MRSPKPKHNSSKTYALDPNDSDRLTESCDRSCELREAINTVILGEPKMTQFSLEWLQHKPKLRLHQRVQATPGVVGRVSGLQQMESGGWRYQMSTPAEYGVTISWWDEEQLRELDDLFMISSIECGRETITRGRGTLWTLDKIEVQKG